ncbi:MAG: DUF805 domain-containing protein [Pseudomonadota bacterium]
MTDAPAYGSPQMGFKEAVTICFQKYVKISGRARRAEFWWFYLFTILLAIVAAILDGLLFGFDLDAPTPIGVVTSLAVLVPTITVIVRRLHDTGRPGYYIFVPLIGLVVGALIMGIGLASNVSVIIGALVMAAGFILQLVWLIQKSQPGTNKYGPSPLEHPGQDMADVFE